MQAIVLIGGYGTRLYPLTYTIPKVLLPLANVPFLTILLEWLKRHRVSQAIFAVSHLAPAILNFLNTHHSQSGLPFVVRPETEPLGSGGALKNCEDLIKGKFILLNGDILTDLDLEGLMSFHESSKAVVTTTVSYVSDTTQYGILDLDESGRAHNWQEKPSPQEAKSHWGNVGAWAMSPEILDFIPRGRFVSLEKEIFPDMFKKGVPFFGYRFDGYWKDLGTTLRYIEANRDLLNGHIRGIAPPGRQIQQGIWVDESAFIAPDVKVTPPVVIGRNCRIAGSVEIKGPTVIGANSEIAPNVRVISSIIWQSSKIEEYAEIRSSIVASARIQRECVINEDSVICPDSVVGRGVILPRGTLLGPGSILRQEAP